MKRLRPFLIVTLMLAYPPAHATSFDCTRGRSLTEKMICHDPALSKLDDTLGQLYWKARRRVSNRRAFLTDSDSKWAWREANCRDAACLGTWYATRIDELRHLIDSMQAGAPVGATDASGTTRTTGTTGPTSESRTAGATDATGTTGAAESTAPADLSARLAPNRVNGADTARQPPRARPAASPSAIAMLQRTAANPGIAVNEQCSTVLRGTSSQWQREPRAGDWFCGVAMLKPAQFQADNAQ